ncbi:hypothetical protein H8D30_04035 [bacterium]|nr:hypothetical protein [bacterium]
MTPSKKNLLLLDGMNLLFRAYYSLPPTMTDPKGRPTNALFGFLRTFIALSETHDPTHVAVALDSKGKTWRDEVYPAYKEGRQDTPEELVEQIIRFRSFLEGLSISLLHEEGQEADDLLASAAHQATKAGMNALVVSGDKDLLQVLAKGVTLLKPGRSIREIAPVTAGSMENEYGFPPHLIPDYKGLVGDSSDNLPGVRGIGDKTARKLLATYGDIEGIYSHLDALPKGQRARLEEGQDAAYLFRKLATLDTERPVELDALLLPDFRSSLAKKTLEEAGMTSFLPAPISEEISVERCNEEELVLFFSTQNDCPLFVLPNEGSYLVLKGERFVSPQEGNLLSPSPPPLHELIPQGARIIGFDLKRVGLSRRQDLDSFDIRLAASLLQSDGAPLGGLWRRYLNENPPRDAPSRLGGLKRLAIAVETALRESELWETLGAIESTFVALLAQMEEWGIYVDSDILDKLDVLFSEQLADLRSQMKDATDISFNPSSPKQVAELLFDHLEIPESSSRSTKKEVLESLLSRHPIIPLILTHRKISKLHGTYVRPLARLRDTSGRVHPVFDPLGTATGRLACRHPNLQNLPVRTQEGRLIRTAFCAPAGKRLLSLDYSQIDLRVLAHLSQDPSLLEAFRTGKDIHTATASLLFEKEEDQLSSQDRNRAKMINFGIIYGMGPARLSKELEIPIVEAKREIEAYFSRFSHIKVWMDGVIREGMKRGYVETFAGRRRLMPDLTSKNNPLRSAAQRQAINTPVQGGSAEIIKRAMLRLAPHLTETRLLLLQIHDELLLEVAEDDCNEAADAAKRAMEGAVDWEVPLVVHARIGSNFGEMEPLDS